MKLIFLGTRANIQHRSDEHFFNAACLVIYRSTCVLIDCGSDWVGNVNNIRPQPQGIIITHAHPDHVAGLDDHVTYSVYALKETFNVIKNYHLHRRCVIKPRKPFVIGDLVIEAFRVEHALNAPAVGYRITAGKKSIFYVPDLVFIKQSQAALRGVDLYIGDGARISHPLVRHNDGHLLGHTTIAHQLEWCRKYKVPRAMFTHCGSEIVTKSTIAKKKIQGFGKEFGVRVSVACDGVMVDV